MKRRFPKYIVIPAALLVYLVAIAVIAWPGYARGEHSALFYFGVIGATLACIIALHFVLKRKEKNRDRYRDA